MKREKALLLIIFLLLCGCAAFNSRPLQPSKTASDFEARTLDSSGLRKFIGKNLKERGEKNPWPPKKWDLNTLSLAALYYHPEMDVARARWG